MILRSHHLIVVFNCPSNALFDSTMLFCFKKSLVFFVETRITSMVFQKKICFPYIFYSCDRERFYLTNGRCYTRFGTMLSCLFVFHFFLIFTVLVAITPLISLFFAGTSHFPLHVSSCFLRCSLPAQPHRASCLHHNQHFFQHRAKQR